MKAGAGTTAIIGLLCGLLVSCGGSGSGNNTASNGARVTDNVQAITVDAGPTGLFANMITTSVTICVPGTTTCQTIADVQVDTGSSGLRLLASAVTLPLPTVSSPGGIFSECTAFADGFVWGPLVTADIRLAGEAAPSMSIQLIQDNGVGPAVPAACSGQGTAENSLATLGANGILGVGVFLQDCGGFCAVNTSPLYYTCSGSGCTQSPIPVALQISNPVAFFAQDNNGVVLQLPAVPATGATAATGNLIFGIGTQADNALDAVAIAVPDSGPTAGAFTAIYKGVTLGASFIDSGSSQFFFDDSRIPICPSSTPEGDLSSFYCPGSATALSTLPLNITLAGSNGAAVAIAPNLANAQFLFAQPGAAALNVFNDLGGPAGSMLPNAFDLGVPFFSARACSPHSNRARHRPATALTSRSSRSPEFPDRARRLPRFRRANLAFVESPASTENAARPPAHLAGVLR